MIKPAVSLLFFALFFGCQNEAETPPTSPAIESQIEILDTAEIESLPADALAAYAKGLENSIAQGSQDNAVLSAFSWGIYYSNRASYQLSTQYYEKALTLLQNVKPQLIQAKIHSAIGNNYTTTGDYPKALNHLFQALKIYEQNDNKPGICQVNAAIGEVYFQKDNLEAAKEHLALAMKTLENEKTNPAYLKAAHTLANVYGMSGDYQSAMRIDREGIRLADSINSVKLKSPFLDNVAQCFLFSNQLDSAAFYFDQCLKIDLAGGNRKQIADTYSNLGHLHLLKKDFTQAEQMTTRSIDMLKSIDAKHNLAKSYTILSDIYVGQGLFKEALKVNEERYSNYKMMMAEKKESAVAEFTIIYDTQKKESTIQLLQQESQIDNLEITEQKNRIDMLYLLLFGFILLIVAIGIIGYFWKSRQKLSNLLEREKAVREMEEQERLRIARDIHDDLGSGLSKINFLSEIIVQQTGDSPDIKSTATSIKETAKKIVDNMRDMIWALNPDNTTIANLVARIREYTTDYLEDYPITLHYDIPPNLPATSISKEVHRELFMVLKESLNNISKHSHATEVNFKVELTENCLTFKIKDNGVGFRIDQQVGGNGLRNMQSRIRSIGLFEVKSEPGAGTLVSFSIVLPEEVSTYPVLS